MSTYLYLTCIAHDPPLRADGESGQHLYDLPQLREDIANRERLIAAYEDDMTFGDPFRANTARFLAEHPRCPLAIYDEYGQRHSTTQPEGADQ